MQYFVFVGREVRERDFFYTMEEAVEYAENLNEPECYIQTSEGDVVWHNGQLRFWNETP